MGLGIKIQVRCNILEFIQLNDGTWDENAMVGSSGIMPCLSVRGGKVLKSLSVKRDGNRGSCSALYHAKI